jgi:molybdopterin-biosynthesis enzyme MoeA-like protein
VGDSSPRASPPRCVRAFASGDIVFSTGGIGATPDDHTRQCAAKCAGRAELALHPAGRTADPRAHAGHWRCEQGVPYEPDRSDNIHRLNMGVFPQGARLIHNPYNKIPGFSVGDVHFVPGFPVMAWPMVESVLDGQYTDLFTRNAVGEKSVIVFGAMEATLTPLMQAIEDRHAGIKVFSLPSVDHPQYGRHIELGVKGDPGLLEAAYAQLIEGLHGFDAKLGPELVR